MKRAVILERTGEDEETRVFKVVFWYPVPAGRESFYADTSYVSALPDTGDLAPTAQELAALRAGAVKEESDNVPLPKKGADGKSFDTTAFLAAAAATIETTYLARLAEIESFNPWLLYGSTYADETGGWQLKTVADVATGVLTPVDRTEDITPVVEEPPVEETTTTPGP